MTIPVVNVLEHNWGRIECPSDLVELHRLAKKKYVRKSDWEGGFVMSQIVDPDTDDGKRYYKRERELLNAINVIYAAGWKVVPE